MRTKKLVQIINDPTYLSSIKTFAEGSLYEFMISPVRNITGQTLEELRGYKEEQRQRGNEVYLPHDDTEQENDPLGLRINTQNKNAILAAQKVGIYLDRTSMGSVFDVGMTFQTNKGLDIHGKSVGVSLDNFSRFIMEYADFTQGFPSAVGKNDYFLALDAFQNELRKTDTIDFSFNPLDKLHLAKLGMVFMAGNKLNLLNLDKLESMQEGPYVHVARALHYSSQK